MDQPLPHRILPKRRLGTSGIEVTVFGFGTSQLGEHKVLIPEEQAQATLHAAWHAGIRYVDTAPLYGYGLAEHRVGAFLRQVSSSDYILSSKVGRLLRPGTAADKAPRAYKGGLAFEVAFDYSYEGTMRSIEDSLQRLGLPGIDVALIHDVDISTHGRAGFEERFREAERGACRAFRKLREERVVGAIGIGVNDAEPCLRFAELGGFDCLMLAGRYTLLEQGPLDTLLPLCSRQNVSLLIAAPFNSGILATGAVEGAYYNYEAAPPEILERVRCIEAICRNFGVPLAAAALQFPLGHPAVASVVLGGIRAAEVERNRALMEHGIEPDFWKALKARGLLHPEAPTPIFV